MYLVGVPLLVVPFAIYNIVAFLMPGVSWSAPFAHVALRSGADWPISPGDVLLTFAILILLVELVKLTRLGLRTWVDHLLALLLFAGMTAEFVTVEAVATPTFFLLLVISFVDFVGGLASALAARARRRELRIEREPAAPIAEPAPKAAPRVEPRVEPQVESQPASEPPPLPNQPNPA
jgi:hypothetical protein